MIRMVVGVVVAGLVSSAAHAQKWPCSASSSRTVESKMLQAHARASMTASWGDYDRNIFAIGKAAGGIQTWPFTGSVGDPKRTRVFDFKPLGFYGTSPQALFLAIAGTEKYSKAKPTSAGQYPRFAIQVYRDASAGTGGAYVNICRVSQDGFSKSGDFAPTGLTSDTYDSFSLDPDAKPGAITKNLTVDAKGNQTYWRWLPADAGTYDNYTIFVEPKSSLRSSRVSVTVVRYVCDKSGSCK